jgi:hypothetical protein
MSATANLAFEPSESFDGRFSLSQCVDARTELVISSNLGSQTPADGWLIHPALHFQTVSLNSRWSRHAS